MLLVVYSQCTHLKMEYQKNARRRALGQNDTTNEYSPFLSCPQLENNRNLIWLKKCISALPRVCVCVCLRLYMRNLFHFNFIISRNFKKNFHEMHFLCPEEKEIETEKCRDVFRWIKVKETQRQYKKPREKKEEMKREKKGHLYIYWERNLQHTQTHTRANDKTKNKKKKKQKVRAARIFSNSHRLIANVISFFCMSVAEQSTAEQAQAYTLIIHVWHVLWT